MSIMKDDRISCVTHEGSEEGIAPLRDSNLFLDLIEGIASALVKVVIGNKNSNKDGLVEVDEFYSMRIPNTTIKAYIERVVRHSKMEASSLVIAFGLIDDLINQHYVLSLRNVFRLFLASAVVCIKYNEDSQFNNSYYAKIGGMKVDEFNSIEYAFFIRIGCYVNVNKERYDEILRTLTH